MIFDHESRITVATNLVTGEVCVGKAIDSTEWPSASATASAFQTLIEIYNLGYRGLKIDFASLEKGGTLYNYIVDEASIEGRLIKLVMALAERGRAIPTGKLMKFLAQTYKDGGLTTPTPAAKQYSLRTKS